MPAMKMNYLVVYPTTSQVYGSGSLEIALSSPAPPGQKIEDKRIYFISIEPDGGRMVWRRLPDEEIQAAEIKLKEKTERKKKKESSSEV